MRVLVGEDREDGQQVEQSFYVPLEREPVMVRFDPEGWLLKTLKFERSSKMMRYQLVHDRDVLGRIEAAEALGAKSDEESVKALQRALMNDSFWGVRVVAAAELGKIASRQAQDVLLQALQKLDLVEFSRVRAAIATALGGFQVPQQAELAERSARALSTLLEKGDISYLVEGATAEALGRTRTAGCVDALMKVVNRPSWNNRVQQNIFMGMGATGEDRVVDILASYLNNEQNHITLRMAAAMGLLSVGRNRYLYSEEARQRAVTALCEAVEHDTWHRVRAFAAMALMALGEKRALGVLERTARAELELRTRHIMRVALHALRTGDKTDDQLKQLRKDLDQVREENRKLKEQIGALEARMK
jgi:aminopeptidase N